MNVLLDTHTLLWAILDDNKLSNPARKLIADTKNTCYYSIVSLWEISIKHSLGSLSLNMSLAECFDIISQTGFTELGITKNHLLVLSELPYHHKDPFDRIIISQAIYENLSLATKDSQIDKYKVAVVW